MRMLIPSMRSQSLTVHSLKMLQRKVSFCCTSYLAAPCVSAGYTIVPGKGFAGTYQSAPDPAKNLASTYREVQRLSYVSSFCAGAGTVASVRITLLSLSLPSLSATYTNFAFDKFSQSFAQVCSWMLSNSVQPSLYH